MSQFPPQAYTRDMLSTAYEWLRSQPTQVRELAKDSDSLVALYMQSRRRSPDSSSHFTVAAPSAEAFKQDLKNLAEGMRQFDEAKPGLIAGQSQNQGPQINSQMPVSQSTGTPLGGVHSAGSHMGGSQTGSQSQGLPHSQGLQQNLNFHQSTQPLQSSFANPAQTPAAQTYSQPQSYAQTPQSIPTMAHSTQPMTYFTQPLAYPAQTALQNSQVQAINHQTYASPPQAQANVLPTQSSNSTPNPLLSLDLSTREKLRSIQLRFNLSTETEALRMLVSIGYDHISTILPK